MWISGNGTAGGALLDLHPTSQGGKDHPAGFRKDTTLVSVVYVVELAVVEPLIVRGEAARAGLLTIEPGGVLNAIDGLGYAFLGLALLFAAPVFAGGGLDRLIRWLLFANGVAVVPILLTYFVDRAFLLIAGPLWGLAVPALAVLLGVSFRRDRKSTRLNSSH